METATRTTNATKNNLQEPTSLENQIATKVMDAAFIVHREMGARLLENVYEERMLDILLENN